MPDVRGSLGPLRRGVATRCRLGSSSTRRPDGLRLSDVALWDVAAAETRVVVTKDKDFLYLAAVHAGPPVVYVALGNVSNADLLARFEAVWPTVLGELAATDVTVARITLDQLLILRDAGPG